MTTETQVTQDNEEIEGIIESFDELVEEGELEQARGLITKALEEHEGNITLTASLAELEIEEENYKEGVELINSVLEEADPGEQRASLLNLGAYAQYYSGQLDESRRTFNQCLREDDDNWSALVGRATAHERMGFLVAALLDLEHAIDIDDQEAEPFALRARIFLKRNDLNQAMRDYGYALESDPYDEESRLNMARLQARAGATDEAIELLELLIEEGENDDAVATGALLRSQLTMALGSVEAAIEDAEVTIARWPERPWGYLQKAACQLTSMQSDAALKSLKIAEAKTENIKDVPDITALRASAYEQLEKDDQARREKAKVEGMARLPLVVYGPILNPAGNTPINPDKPIDIRAILADLFGSPEHAPKGYEDALRDIIDKIPEIIADNPNVERIQIELPEVEGMRSNRRNLVIQVNQQMREQQQAQA